MKRWIHATTDIPNPQTESDMLKLLQKAMNKIYGFLPKDFYIDNCKYGLSGFSIDIYKNTENRPYGGTYFRTFRFVYNRRDLFKRDAEKQLSDSLNKFQEKFPKVVSDIEPWF